MANKITLWAKALFCLCLGVALNGCITSPPIALDQIAWTPQQLDFKDCPNIDGAYTNGAELMRIAIATPVYPENLFHQRQQERFFKDIPYPEFGRGDVSREVAAIDSRLIASIKINSRIAVLTLMDKSGELYRTKTVHLDAVANPIDRGYGNMWVFGCDQGDFVERSVSSGGGADFTSRTVTATEKRLRRLLNGDLRVQRQDRHWVDGKGDKPLVKEETKIFPFYSPKG